MKMRGKKREKMNAWFGRERRIHHTAEGNHGKHHQGNPMTDEPHTTSNPTPSTKQTRQKRTTTAHATKTSGQANKQPNRRQDDHATLPVSKDGAMRR